MVNNPYLLLSIINTKLRDYYATFSLLCKDLNYDELAIINLLKSIGYVYDQTKNQFIREEVFSNEKN